VAFTTVPFLNNTLIGTLLCKWLYLHVFFHTFIHDRGFLTLPGLGHFFIRNQIRNRAYKLAQHTAQAFIFDQIRSTILGIPVYGLAGGILTDDITLPAADTLIQIVLGDALALNVKNNRNA
jgi:hypothetical protein